MKIIVLGGFLGSGKTSLLMSMAEYLAKHNINESETLLAIIENEIGEIGIDNQILKGGKYEISILFSGCICCTLASDLTVALNDIAEKYHPEYTVIEATGLAYPDRIADTIKDYGKYIDGIKIIVIVDAQRWEENYDVLEVLISGQIKSADMILLNKIDTIGSEAVLQIKKQLNEINHCAAIYPVSAKNGIENEVWSSVLKRGNVNA